MLPGNGRRPFLKGGGLRERRNSRTIWRQETARNIFDWASVASCDAPM